jgi:hypothetical protein
MRHFGLGLIFVFFFMGNKFYISGCAIFLKREIYIKKGAGRLVQAFLY